MEHFGAKRCTYDGYSFDSKSEMRRYQELKLLKLAGEIEELEVHPKYTILPAWPDHKSVTFEADFAYHELKTDCYVTEDVKPHKNNGKGQRVPYLTREFTLRWKLFQYWYRARDARIVEA